MTIVRFTLALLASLIFSTAASAQDAPVIGNGSGPGGSLAYIQSALRSFGSDDTTDRNHDQVVTNLEEHPVHAMRRRRAIHMAAESTLRSASPKDLSDTAREIGLHGRWYVLSSKKDGPFSEAQIGQQPGDVISLLPKEDAPGLFPMG